METRANYLMVGAFVLLFSLGLLGFVVWLAKFQSQTETVRYDIFFKGSVTGLKEGSPVRYNGVKVGDVIFIGLDRDNPSRVRAMVELEGDAPVKNDTEASLALEGLTGGRYILLSGGSLDSAPLEKEPDQKRAVIPSKQSAIDTVMESAPELFVSAQELLVKAQLFLSDANREKVDRILGNFEQVSLNFQTASATLAEQAPGLEGIIADTASTMENLREASGGLSQMSVSLQADSKRLAEKADDALSSIQNMAQEFEAIAAENRKPISEFTNGGLYELTTLLTEARALLVGLNRVTTEVERDPARFLFGNQQQGYEAQQ